MDNLFCVESLLFPVRSPSTLNVDPDFLHSDEYLFSFLKDGDEQAFTMLYDRYWKKLLVRAHMLLGCPEDAEELVHDIFVTLWRKRESIDIRHSFRAYIAAMLEYGCYRALRERKRKKESLRPEILGESPDYTTEQWLDYEYLRKELESAIRLLPDRCRLVFRLSREEGLSDKEIARQLNVSVNTVRTQMHRALSKMKTSLGTFFCL